MNLSAIQHQAFDTYCYPLNKDQLKISIKTGRDITKVEIFYGDPFLSKKNGDHWVWVRTCQEINKKIELENHFIWSIIIEPPFKRSKYYFKIYSGTESILFFEDGFYTQEEFDASPDIVIPFIFPWMNEADIVNPPEWAKNTIWYQIFPSRFNHSTKGPVVEDMVPWTDSKTPVTNHQKFGGNLEGIIEKLGYLENLGINGLYLNPVNFASSQHKYDTIDYLQIDPEFGDENTMKRLVEEAHKKGMHVMLDGVFNHSGWFYWAWQDVLKNKQNSKYASWYMVNNWDFPTKPYDSAAKGYFYSFAFTDYMPKLNTSNPELREYIITVCEKWIQQYNIDGIRLDVANEISHVLCQELRSRLRLLKEDFFIVGEIWNNSLPWLRGNEFDSVINYPLRSAIYDFQFRKKSDVKVLEQKINLCLTNYYDQTQKVIINQMDSHDTARLITKTNGDKDATKLQFAMIFTLPGSACIYYGTEVLLEGGEDPDCRRCMPWKEIEQGAFDQELSFMKTMISLRKEHEAFRSTDISFVYPENDLTGSNRLVHYIKSDEKGNKIHCYFNFGTQDQPIPLNKKSVLYSQKYKDAILQTGGFVFIKE